MTPTYAAYRSASQFERESKIDLNWQIYLVTVRTELGRLDVLRWHNRRGKWERVTKDINGRGVKLSELPENLKAALDDYCQREE